jgi:hypothetical protein
MAEIYIPTLHTFAMNNVFTGSCGDLRFKITPKVTKKNSKKVDFDASSMDVEIWHGLFCYEKSEIEDSKNFPMSDQGRSELIAFLNQCI